MNHHAALYLLFLFFLSGCQVYPQLVDGFGIGDVNMVTGKSVQGDDFLVRGSHMFYCRNLALQLFGLNGFGRYSNGVDYYTSWKIEEVSAAEIIFGRPMLVQKVDISAELDSTRRAYPCDGEEWSDFMYRALTREIPHNEWHQKGKVGHCRQMYSASDILGPHREFDVLCGKSCWFSWFGDEWLHLGQQPDVVVLGHYGVGGVVETVSKKSERAVSFIKDALEYGNCGYWDANACWKLSPKGDNLCIFWESGRPSHVVRRKDESQKLYESIPPFDLKDWNYNCRYDVYGFESDSFVPLSELQMTGVDVCENSRTVYFGKVSPSEWCHIFVYGNGQRMRFLVGNAKCIREVHEYQIGEMDFENKASRASGTEIISWYHIRPIFVRRDCVVFVGLEQDSPWKWLRRLGLPRRHFQWALWSQPNSSEDPTTPFLCVPWLSAKLDSTWYETLDELCFYRLDIKTGKISPLKVSYSDCSDSL